MHSVSPLLKWHTAGWLAVGVWLGCLVTWAANAAGQSILFAEDFNNDGNGSRYRLVRNYLATLGAMVLARPRALGPREAD